MFGGIVSGFIGISSVFIVTSSLFLVAFTFLYLAKRKPRQDFEDFLAEENQAAKT
jgi:DHA1 family multidrug resistance protein-like MFS transporter